MTQSLNFKAEDRPVKDVLFANDAKFRIPIYQRGYSWKEDQMEELWSDLLNEESAFIGSMIFNFEHQSTSGEVDVIDGQQRLLSITIISAVIRDTAELFDQELSKLIHRQDIAYEGRDGIDGYRVVCGETTQPFFLKYIQQTDFNITEATTKNGSEEHRIKANYLYVKKRLDEQLEGKDHSTKIQIIKGIRKKLENLIVIHVRIDSEEDAYEIFETTNARGVDLTVADLVKNLILKKLKSEGKGEQAKKKWDEITHEVSEAGDAQLKRFIRYYWIAQNPTCSETKLYREIKKTKDWGGLLEGMRVSAHLFSDLFNNSAQDWKQAGLDYQVAESLENLKKMGFSISYIFLLPLLVSKDALKPKQLRPVVAAIENFTFTYLAVCGDRVSPCEKIFSTRARELNQALVSDVADRRAHLDKVFAGLKTDLDKLKPTLERFTDSFMQIKYGKAQRARSLVGYILAKIDDELSVTNEVDIDWNQVNIEHIMPQSPEDNWGLTKRAVAGYVNSLGNLTLVDQRINSSIGNESLETKLQQLKKSSLAVTKDFVTELGDKKSWGEDDIKARQQRFASIAYETIWRTPMPNK